MVAITMVPQVGHCAKSVYYEGRVVDAETQAAIEGALVVAIWYEWKGGGMLYKERFKDARECLTDAEGRWAFTGPSGGPGPVDDTAIITSFVTGYRTKRPEFHIYEKGYEGFGDSTSPFRGFVARPIVQPERDIEGILLIRPGVTESERQVYRENYSEKYALPLIPTSEPEKRLRAIDFSIAMDAAVKKVSRSLWPGNSYAVHGLKKRRKGSRHGIGYPPMPTGAGEKLPILRSLKEASWRVPRHSMPTRHQSGGVVVEMPPPPKKE